MGSAIYTRSGDGGTTALNDGSRVSKDAARVEAYGTVDEANSWIGAARAMNGDPLLDRALEFVQHRFYNCSSNLATPPKGDSAPSGLDDEDIHWLEQTIDRFEQASGKIGGFILPGGCKLAGQLHLARTVCRRAERRLVSLSRHEPVDQNVQKFINRASDFLFAAARYANTQAGRVDVLWSQELPRPRL